MNVSEPSPFRRNLLLNLRKSIIVVSVVAVGLFIYAQANGEAVQWLLVLLVAIGMLISSLANAWFDAKKESRRQRS